MNFNSYISYYRRFNKIFNLNNSQAHKNTIPKIQNYICKYFLFTKKQKINVFTKYIHL